MTREKWRHVIVKGVIYFKNRRYDIKLDTAKYLFKGNLEIVVRTKMMA